MTVDLACVDLGDTGTEPAAAAQAQGIKPQVVKLPLGRDLLHSSDGRRAYKDGPLAETPR
jgi:hypothetical protein